MEVEGKHLAMIGIILAIIVGGLAYFTYFRTEPGTMPRNFNVLAQDESLKESMVVNASASPDSGTELGAGDAVSANVEVEWKDNQPLSDKDYNITFTFVVSKKGGDMDVSLLVGKEKFGVNSYVNSLGSDWELVGSDSKTLEEIEGTESFDLEVTF